MGELCCYHPTVDSALGTSHPEVDTVSMPLLLIEYAQTPSASQAYQPCVQRGFDGTVANPPG